MGTYAWVLAYVIVHACARGMWVLSMGIWRVTLWGGISCATLAGMASEGYCTTCRKTYAHGVYVRGESQCPTCVAFSRFERGIQGTGMGPSVTDIKHALDTHTLVQLATDKARCPMCGMNISFLGDFLSHTCSSNGKVYVLDRRGVRPEYSAPMTPDEMRELRDTVAHMETPEGRFKNACRLEVWYQLERSLSGADFDFCSLAALASKIRIAAGITTQNLESMTMYVYQTRPPEGVEEAKVHAAKQAVVDHGIKAAKPVAPRLTEREIMPYQELVAAAVRWAHAMESKGKVDGLTAFRIQQTMATALGWEHVV